MNYNNITLIEKLKHKLYKYDEILLTGVLNFTAPVYLNISISNYDYWHNKTPITKSNTDVYIDITSTYYHVTTDWFNIEDTKKLLEEYIKNWLFTPIKSSDLITDEFLYPNKYIMDIPYYEYDIDNFIIDYMEENNITLDEMDYDILEFFDPIDYSRKKEITYFFNMNYY